MHLLTAKVDPPIEPKQGSDGPGEASSNPAKEPFLLCSSTTAWNVGSAAPASHMYVGKLCRFVGKQVAKNVRPYTRLSGRKAKLGKQTSRPKLQVCTSGEASTMESILDTQISIYV